MFCPKCGTDVPEGSKFCETCGNNMQLAEPEVNQAQYDQPAQSSQEPEPAAPQPVQEPQPVSSPQPQPTNYQQPQAQSYQQGSYNSGYQQAPQPAPAYQNNYNPTYQNSYNNVDPLDKPYSVGGWLLTYLILLIPIVNIVMPFVWAFGSNTNKSKKNFFIAYLIMAAIGIVLLIAFYGILAAMINGILSEMNF
ncbi:MAG: zinc-ribbon domain-containing protein [Clostridiaceae bacterium]|jgi:DNA mismatch repair ATPase MutL|nr:zinc-ribbon domain-containing protein [Clostridiaceae bacterium]